MVPSYWLKFITEKSLVGADVEIPWEDDDQMTHSIEIFNEKNCIDEAINYWPGIGVTKDGFVPIGGCSTGSGDPYFINTNDGENGPLYQIYHDFVSEDGL